MTAMLDDLALLRQGQPPTDDVWLEEMTAAREVWLDRFRQHYLENYIHTGGSKVKLLVGSEGSGKTHLLRCVQADARVLGYVSVFLSLRDSAWKLSDIVSLYKAVAARIDHEELLSGLCRLVADKLGYDPEPYNGSASILPLLVEKEGLTRDIALRELRKAAVRAFDGSDLSPPFYTLAYTLVASRMGTEQRPVIEGCWKWASGDKLEPAEKKTSRLYDRLTKPNGRIWLYSLVRLLRLSGKAGIVVFLDDLDVMLERSAETGRFLYTPNAAKDAYELIRQLIDDVELLPHFMLLLGGRSGVLEDERRGFKSYEALWMRLQTGLAPTHRFNPWADIVDVDDHMAAAGGEELARTVGQRLQDVLLKRGMARRYRELPPPCTSSPLRKVVMETALMTDAQEV